MNERDYRYRMLADIEVIRYRLQLVHRSIDRHKAITGLKASIVRIDGIEYLSEFDENTSRDSIVIDISSHSLHTDKRRKPGSFVEVSIHQHTPTFTPHLSISTSSTNQAITALIGRHCRSLAWVRSGDRFSLAVAFEDLLDCSLEDAKAALALAADSDGIEYCISIGDERLHTIDDRTTISFDDRVLVSSKNPQLDLDLDLDGRGHIFHSPHPLCTSHLLASVYPSLTTMDERLLTGPPIHRRLLLLNATRMSERSIFYHSPDPSVDGCVDLTAHYPAYLAHVNKLVHAIDDQLAIAALDDENEHLVDRLVRGQPVSREELRALLGKTSTKGEQLAIPQVQWADVGGLEDAKKEIRDTITLTQSFKHLLSPVLGRRSGILFYGPPGTGKTLLAKCIANECGLRFISVKGPELLNMYVGESEKNIREIFEKARLSAPSIVFFDEIDSLLPRRGNSTDSSSVSDRMIAQFLTEMDACMHAGNIYVIGATNRPDLLDPSIMQPGRFDVSIYLGIDNDPATRIKVLRSQTRKMQVRCSFEEVEKLLPQNFTGADIFSFTSTAYTAAMNRLMDRFSEATRQLSARDCRKFIEAIPAAERAVVLTMADFEAAAQQVKRSVSDKEIEAYEAMRQGKSRN